jgi:dsRNA-specific ribonuclease
MGTRRAMARGMGRNRADAEAAAVRNALQKLRREIVRSQRGA